MDNRLTNIALRSENGVDFATAMRWETGLGEISATLSGTYLLKLRDKSVPGAPYADLLNTTYYPVDLRMRDSLGWSYKGFSATAFLNYTDGYRNRPFAPSQRVASWTTVDMDFRYRTSARSEFWSDVVLSLSVHNLFDREPPFVTAPSGGAPVHFDATNADPLGRFAAFQISKAW